MRGTLGDHFTACHGEVVTLPCGVQTIHPLYRMCPLSAPKPEMGESLHFRYWQKEYGRHLFVHPLMDTFNCTWTELGQFVWIGATERSELGGRRLDVVPHTTLVRSSPLCTPPLLAARVETLQNESGPLGIQRVLGVS